MDLPMSDLQRALAERFAKKPLAYWRGALSQGSTTVVPLASLHSTRDASLQLESEGPIDIATSTFRVIRHDQHPSDRWCDLVAPNAVRPENARITIPGPMPKYGMHTREVLAELGYAVDEIDQMVKQGAAAESWSEKYLPE